MQYGDRIHMTDRFRELHGDEYQELKHDTADDFADGWDWTEMKWTDEVKRMKLVTDDASHSIALYHHDSDGRWIVTLYSNDKNNDDRRYNLYGKSSNFERYQDARDYVVELTEQYP